MSYETHLAAAEAAAWPLETSIAWSEIDIAAAAAERDIHVALHDAALIEGYLPLYAARLMQMLWDDVDATAVLSMELYEGLRHYTALTRYLDLAGFQCAAVTGDVLVRARCRALGARYEAEDILVHLTNFMCSELFAAYFFLRLSRRSREPVLQRLLAHMSRDEFRHAASAGDLLRQRVARDPTAAERILAAAERFRHYGSDAVDVPVAEDHDLEAIAAMNRKVRAVCGMAPVEHLKEGMQHADQ